MFAFSREAMPIASTTLLHVIKLAILPKQQLAVCRAVFWMWCFCVLIFLPQPSLEMGKTVAEECLFYEVM